MKYGVNHLIKYFKRMRSLYAHAYVIIEYVCDSICGSLKVTRSFDIKLIDMWQIKVELSLNLHTNKKF